MKRDGIVKASSNTLLLQSICDCITLIDLNDKEMVYWQATIGDFGQYHIIDILKEFEIALRVLSASLVP